MQVLLTMVLAAVLSVMLAREARADEVELGAEDTLGAEEDLLPGPVEPGRYRTSRESNLYLAIPIGQGRLCLIDPEAYAATRPGESAWSSTARSSSPGVRSAP